MYVLTFPCVIYLPWMLHIPVLVICTPACRNGGKCQWNPSSSTAECDCPVDTTGSYCQHKGTCNQGNACMLTTVEVHELPPCISFVQRSVTQVAKMEEFAIIVHIIFTISVIVPPALLDLTANTKVRATRNMHANNRWITKYAMRPSLPLCSDMLSNLPEWRHMSCCLFLCSLCVSQWVLGVILPV